MTPEDKGKIFDNLKVGQMFLAKGVYDGTPFFYIAEVLETDNETIRGRDVWDVNNDLLGDWSLDRDSFIDDIAELKIVTREINPEYFL